MNSNDLFLWSDGFWCFREEYDDKFLREKNYRVVTHKCDEWVTLNSGHPLWHTPAPAK